MRGASLKAPAAPAFDLVTIGVGERSTSAFVSPPARRSSPVFVLAHGAGGSSSDPLIVATSTALAARGYGVVRFNFLYREAGKKLPDKTPVLEDTWDSVLDWVVKQYPRRGRRLVIGGKSMGGRMATHLAARGRAVDGLLLLGYPLHPAKRPTSLRDAHLPAITVRTFFAQGERDALCDLGLLRAAMTKMGGRARLLVIEGADHSLALPKKRGRSREDVVAEVVEGANAWLLEDQEPA